MSLKYDPIRWSRQHEDCCQKLSENLHVPGDQVLVAIARISKITVEVAGMIHRISEDHDYAAYALMHVKTLKSLLDETKRTLTTEQLQHSKCHPSICCPRLTLSPQLWSRAIFMAHTFTCTKPHSTNPRAPSYLHLLSISNVSNTLPRACMPQKAHLILSPPHLCST
jgi:hypothetical protein